MAESTPPTVPPSGAASQHEDDVGTHPPAASHAGNPPTSTHDGFKMEENALLDAIDGSPSLQPAAAPSSIFSPSLLSALVHAATTAATTSAVSHLAALQTPAAAQPPAPRGNTPAEQLALLRRLPDAPKYDGKASPQRWLETMADFFSTAGIQDDSVKVFWAGQHMTDRAAEWYTLHKRMDSFPTWAAFTDLCSRTFQSITEVQDARNKLHTAKQRESDSVQHFAVYLQQLYLATQDPVSDATKLDRFIRGLLPHLQREVMLRDPQSLQEAITMAAKFEVIHRQASRSSGSSSGSGKNSQPTKQPVQHTRSDGKPGGQHNKPSGSSGTSAHHHGKPANRQQSAGPRHKPLTEAEKLQYRTQNKCAFCRQDGHTIESCPDPRCKVSHPAGTANNNSQSTGNGAPSRPVKH
jgi:hypothetical protein